MDVMRQNLEKELNDTFYSDSEDDIETLRLSKKLYRSCMDLDSIESRGVEPMKMIMKEFGGWPVVEGYSWNERVISWQDIIKSFNKKGLFIRFPLIFSTMPHLTKNSSQLLLLVRHKV